MADFKAGPGRIRGAGKSSGAAQSIKKFLEDFYGAKNFRESHSMEKRQDQDH